MKKDDKIVCKYCGSDSVNPGRSCAYSPDGYHRFATSYDKCEMCLSTNYGGGCSYPATEEFKNSKDNKDNIKHYHIHGHGSKNGRGVCRYCGYSGGGQGQCSYSPDGKHHY